MSVSNVSIPDAVRARIPEWVFGVYGRQMPVPVRLIAVVPRGGVTVFRLEVDVAALTGAGHPQFVYLEVRRTPGGEVTIDHDSVVIFD